ncbi:MAG: 4a-hydroxytetrahydrobiopterin dehydratase [Gammaproteobacteria bacterium]|nr:4a-hydroxytetrahydrobiopterin dehydratase [Gammaproteobacteria bacterium]
MSELENKHCVPCEGGVEPLSLFTARELLKDIPEWEISTDGKKISRRFSFRNFYVTMGFVNAISWMANQENHHPDLEVGFNYCVVHYQTHAINGLSENDFICAAKVNQLEKRK